MQGPLFSCLWDRIRGVAPTAGVLFAGSVLVFYFNREERVVGENEERVMISAAEDDVDRTLRNIDLGDLFARGTVDENLPVGNIHIALAIDRDALTAALREGLEISQRAVGSDARAVSQVFRRAADVDA